MLPKQEGPPLPSQIASMQAEIESLHRRSAESEKRLRRIAPLDSEFADVQVELERFRKLFEFVQAVLPPEKSKAMEFFNKHEAAEDKIWPPDPSVKRKHTSKLANSVESTLGPEISFEHHRDQLTQEVRNHEKKMSDEFGNLAVAIKAV